MANIVLTIAGKEVSVTPKDKALFQLSPKAFLRRVVENMALVLKASAEEAGTPISKEELDKRKKESPAFRLVAGKNWTEVSANCADLLARVEEIKAIKAEADMVNAAYAPKSFEAYEEEAGNMVNAEKDAILTAVHSAIKD